MLVDMCLPKFDIYRSTVAPNCFNSLDAKVDIILKPINWFTTMATLALNELRATENLDVLISLKKNSLLFDMKFTLSDATSFLPDNLSEL